MNSKGFWYFLMIGAIGLWAGAAAAGFYFYPGYGMPAWYFFIILAAAHASEIPLVLRILKDREVSKGTIVLKTFVFGFTWWLPVKKGIITF